MQEITAFRDLHGNLHHSRSSCLTADRAIKAGQTLQKEVDKIMQPLEDRRPFLQQEHLRNGDWIQHDPKVVLSVARALMGLVKRECPTSCERLDKLTLHQGFRGIANEITFFFGRLYSAGVDHRPLEKAANNLGCVRLDGRQFNQPYFTTCHESEIEGSCVSDNSLYPVKVWL